MIPTKLAIFLEILAESISTFEVRKFKPENHLNNFYYFINSFKALMQLPEIRERDRLQPISVTNQGENQ